MFLSLSPGHPSGVFLFERTLTFSWWSTLEVINQPQQLWSLLASPRSACRSPPAHILDLAHQLNSPSSPCFSASKSKNLTLKTIDHYPLLFGNLANFHCLLRAKAPSSQNHVCPKLATLSIKPAHAHNRLLDQSAGHQAQLLFDLGVKFRDTLYYPFSFMNMTNIFCLKKMKQQLLCDS